MEQTKLTYTPCWFPSHMAVAFLRLFCSSDLGNTCDVVTENNETAIVVFFIIILTSVLFLSVSHSKNDPKEAMFVKGTWNRFCPLERSVMQN